jgi:SAM-dependent methyltransferase
MRRSNPSRSVPHVDGDSVTSDGRNRVDAMQGPARSRSGDARTWSLAVDVLGVPGGGGVHTREAGSKLSEPKRPPVLALFDDVHPRSLRMPKARYGMYPLGLIEKVLPWLLCARHDLVHVCSGGLPPGEGIRVDRDPSAAPDILADGRHLPFRDGSIAALLIDPPYTNQYAAQFYGFDYPRPAHLLAEAARVVRPGGRIGFVHYITPRPAKGTRCVKVFGLSTGANMPMRAVTIYERDQRGLGL